MENQLAMFGLIIDAIMAVFLFLTAVATFGIWLSAGKIGNEIKLLTHQRNLDEKVELCMEIMSLTNQLTSNQQGMNLLIMSGNQNIQPAMNTLQQNNNIIQAKLDQKMQQWFRICDETDKIHKDD